MSKPTNLLVRWFTSKNFSRTAIDNNNSKTNNEVEWFENARPENVTKNIENH